MKDRVLGNMSFGTEHLRRSCTIPQRLLKCMKVLLKQEEQWKLFKAAEMQKGVLPAGTDNKITRRRTT